MKTTTKQNAKQNSGNRSVDGIKNNKNSTANNKNTVDGRKASSRRKSEETSDTKRDN